MTTLLTASQTVAPARALPQTGRLTRLLTTAHQVPTPTLLIDPGVVEANYRRIARAFGSAQIYYAVKANPHPAILNPLIALGCGLDVASGSETELALAQHTRPDRIIFTAPFKRSGDIALAHRRGVNYFVADSPGEIENIARHAPASRLLVRVATGGSTCLTPMGAKFGANPEDVLPLLDAARRHGLRPHGLHFHVGSQCLDAHAWARAISFCAPLWHAAREQGLDLRVLDIGGGFPVRYDRTVPAIETIAASALAALRDHLDPEVQLAVEPGRWMSRGAAVLVTEVIGAARRGTGDWVYLDAGLYNGLIDAMEGVVYPMRTLDELATGRRRPRRRITLAGPSCDGNDVLLRDVDAPALTIGDRLLLFQAGAYTTSFERFNGLAYPGVVNLATLRASA